MELQAVTLITGASSGIGAELARVFAARGHQLVLTARSEPDLTTVAEAIAATGRPRPHIITADLGLPDAGTRLEQELSARGLEPENVINNAGFGLVGAAGELDSAHQLAMIDLNVRALTDLSLRWIGGLTRRRGGLLNVASVAGFLPGPGMAVYYATKAYVVSFSQALHHELKAQGVRVTALCPGPVPTRFQERSGMRETWITRLFEYPADKVALAGYAGLAAGKRLVVPGFASKVLVNLVEWAPDSVLMHLGDSRRRRGTPIASHQSPLSQQ